MTDCERLQAGELVYSGVRRTPVCAVAHAVPFGRAYCPLAAELFATTLDVYLLLGKIPENATDTNTADGRSATIAAAHQRLARAVCCDQTELPIDQARSIARFLADVQRQRINGALAKVLSRRPFTMSNADSRESEVPTAAKPHVVISGSGSFLASHVIRSNTTLCDVTVTDLSELLNCSIAETACAFAVARLAQERIRPLN